jgi:hypothetical protein
VCLPGGGPCRFPQMAILDEIVEQNPDAAFILNTRDPRAIVRSIDRWGSLRARMVAADLPGLPPGAGGGDAELLMWIEAHYAAVDRRLGGHPGYVRFDIANDPAGKLVAALGLPAGSELSFPCCNVNVESAPV